MARPHRNVTIRVSYEACVSVSCSRGETAVPPVVFEVELSRNMRDSELTKEVGYSLAERIRHALLAQRRQLSACTTMEAMRQYALSIEVVSSTWYYERFEDRKESHMASKEKLEIRVAYRAKVSVVAGKTDEDGKHTSLPEVLFDFEFSRGMTPEEFEKELGRMLAISVRQSLRRELDAQSTEIEKLNEHQHIRHELVNAISPQKRA